MAQPVAVIHGGAGTILPAAMTEEKERDFHSSMRRILTAAQGKLAEGRSALDVAVEAVRLMEDCPLFNAGHGSVFTSQGTHELDASVMEGSTLGVGAVSLARRTKNPVLAARAVMEKSEHVYFSGPGADAFAEAHGMEMVDQSYYSTDFRREQLEKAQEGNSEIAVLDHDGQALVARSAEARGVKRKGGPIDEDRKMGTVGCVALDAKGNLAAATSTGGMTNKMPGRVGDSPVIGAGTYANNRTCAVSCTGKGEAFIRAVAAYDVSAQMDYGGVSLEEASNRLVVEKLPEGSGGIIAVDSKGNIAMPFNTVGMYRGYARLGEEPVTFIYK